MGRSSESTINKAHYYQKNICSIQKYKRIIDTSQNGLFQYSRNPIYLGVLISNLGFFLMMPNALSFAFVIVSYFALEVKIRLEEKYLEENHSMEYAAY